MLDKVLPGDNVSAAQWNNLIRKANRRVTGPRVMETEDGWFIRDQPLPDITGIDVQQFIIQSIVADSLKCLKWDGTDLGTEIITVIKPYTLRQSPWDNQTRENTFFVYANSQQRVATDIIIGSIKIEFMTPRYLIGDIIYATKPVSGGIDRTVEEGEWLDDNRDGRQWLSFDENQNTATQQFKIGSIEDDHLICFVWDGFVLGETPFIIVKPYTLRRSPWDGLERNGITFEYTDFQVRNATDQDENTIEEKVTPKYLINDVIYASRPIGGNISNTNLEPQQLAGAWLDDNRDGRLWLGPGGDNGIQVKQYWFFSQDWDFFKANDKTQDPWVLVKIAKPYLLRPSQNILRAQVSYTYTASAPHQRQGSLFAGNILVTQEDQLIIPEYVRDDLIYGLTLDSEVIGPIKNLEGQEQNVTVLDTNNSGRAWAAIFSRDF